MNEDNDHLEAALRSLKPRAPGGHVVAALHREFDKPVTGDSRSWFLKAGLLWAGAMSVCFVIFMGFNFTRSGAVPNYRLIGVTQSEPSLDLFNPIQLKDGTYARPVRVHWDRSAQWEDASTRTRLIHYQPEEKLALIPLEIF
ncbi:MAG: hypothetical protein EBS00_01980 [Verrucomicrobia bacterium]|nr:hypothetical protein [Verrucomicrobiota bacterium]